MTREKIINICDKVIEGCFYVLLVSVTFSTSLVEIFASLMILSWIVKTVHTKDLQVFKLTPTKLLILLLIWTLLSCLNSSYPKESFRGVFKIVEYSLLFVVMASKEWDKVSIKRSLNVLIGGAVLVCGNGFFQYFTGKGLIRQRTLIPLDYMRRISSSFIHPNDFGVYLLIISAIFLSIVFSKKVRLKDRVFFFISMVISLISLFLTRSRGAWLSFSAAFLTIGAMKTKKIAASFLALLLIVFLMLPYTVQERIFDLTDLKSGTAWERVMLWKGAVNMIKEHPILGFGVNTYSRNFPKFKPENYPDVRYSHNCYLHMASEIGIVGALIFLIFLITVLVYSFRRISSMSSGMRKDLSVGLFAGLVGFSLNAVVDTHLYSVNLAVLFYLLLGFCFSLVHNAENK